MKKQFVLLISLVVSFCHNAIAQADALSDLKSKFENYSNHFPSEKLYVHTDKSFYTAGEIVWFKIYKLSDSINIDVASRVAYVEILDDHNMAVAKAKIEMNEKGGSGSVELPLTLNSGYYTFRAYTNWMKNFGADHFFEKKMVLVNPLKSLNPVEPNSFYGAIDFFPEGGNLVNGIVSQIAFKVVDQNGAGTSGKGFLLDEKNDTIIKFSPFKFGLGSFRFTPDLSHQYKAVFVFDDNKIIAKPMPQIYEQGYVMHVEDDGSKIKVAVQSNVSSGYPEIFLIAQNHQKIKAAKRNVLSNGSAVFSIDKIELGAGISQLTIFNNEKQSVCERLFFMQPIQNTFVNVRTEKESYSNREQVSLRVSSLPSVPANLSLSVYQIDSLQTKDASDINSYVWLESELNGKIEDPKYYFSDAKDVKQTADYLMLTHGWRKFDWNKVVSSPATIAYAPELFGQIITCKVSEAATGKAAPDVQVYLSIPETSYKLYTGVTDSSGIARIRVKDFFGKGELIVQTENKLANYKIEVISPYSEEYTATPYSPFTISPDQKNLLENYSIAMQAQHIYRGDSIQKFLAPDIKDSFPFFGRAPYSYKLDNYTRFTTMEEVLREYVREINVGVKGSGDLKFKLFNEDSREYYTNNILVVVDGVPVFNTSKIFSFDPLKINHLDIITKNYVLGNSDFYGLASFSTYQGNHEGVDVDPKAISLDYEGLQMQREFYSPEYLTEQQRQSRIPDLRTTLFWSPEIKVNQQVQFYTGDNKGKYIVIVEGINKNGEPVSSATEFDVN